jgi:pimeloyl-ACP methyl ester carboxylesterase
VWLGSVEVLQENELEIADERIGKGPPLVFVHGAGDDGRIWRPQLDALRDEFTPVAWDEPGAGRSSDVPSDFSLADYAESLATLLDALGLAPAQILRAFVGRHGRLGALPSPPPAR